MQATTLVFANHKGGCGKTTSTANLAVTLAARGLSTVAVDADPQGNLGQAFGVTPELGGPRLEDALRDPDAHEPPNTIWETATGVDLIPCSPCLHDLAAEQATDPQFPLRLSELTVHLAGSYHAILIDTPPGIGPLSSMAMLAADWVIVPARPADFDVSGALQLATLIREELQPLNPKLRLLGVLPTQVDRRWRLTQETRDQLDAAGIRRLRTEIPFRVRVGSAPRHGVPTAALEPDGAVGAAYDLLAADLIGPVFTR